jgi:hypothetical protein
LNRPSGYDIKLVRHVSDRHPEVSNGLSGLETELYQYIPYDNVVKEKGPKRIVLDDASTSKTKYTPPSNLVVHLSKIDMPELQPKSNNNDKSSKKSKEEKKGW